MMYERYYELSAKPFSKTPDPAFLYLSNQHKEALARLELAVEERELAVLLGAIGCGKTTLSRALIDKLSDNQPCALIINPNLPPTQLLAQIAQGLGISAPPRQKRPLVDAIQTRLFACYEQNKSPVIIIDEAQLIPSKACFDDLRLLTNFQLDDRNLFTLILIGQPELQKRLAHPAYEAFRQRVGLICRLGPLAPEETRRYIEHRLKKAGARKGIFTPAAVERLHTLGGGIPRVLNHLAANALLEGMGRELRSLGPDVIDDVYKDMAFELG